MQRRAFLKFGAAGMLMAGGLGWLGKQFASVEVVTGESVITPAHQPMLRALLRGILEGVEGATTPDSIEMTLQNLIGSSKTLAPATQAELGQLLNILENPVGRRLIADLGTDWDQASTAHVQAFLLSFRDHPIPALQPGYHALHDLGLASWYSQGKAWQTIGYPGPPFQLA